MLSSSDARRCAVARGRGRRRRSSGSWSGTSCSRAGARSRPPSTRARSSAAPTLVAAADHDRDGDVRRSRRCAGRSSSSTSGRRGASPCKKEAPALERAWRRSGATAASSSSASTSNDFRGAASRFVDRHGVTYPIVRDGGGLDARQVGRDRPPGDVLRRPQGPGRAAARGRGGDARPARRGDPARAPLVRLARRRCSRCARRGARARERAAPDAGRARGRAHLPDLPHDARHVRLADRARDEDVHPRRIAAGETKSADRAEARRRSSAPASSASPRKHGFDLLAWLLPLGGILVGGAVARGRRVALVAERASARRRSDAPPAPPLDPELERRVDEELRRFDG